MQTKHPTIFENFKDSRSGPLDIFIPPFISSLVEQGYARSSLDGKMKIIRKFVDWIEKHRINVDNISKQTIVFFSRKTQGQGTFVGATFQLSANSSNGCGMRE
jgi:hypothetical protein